jgi:Ca-activated chloride channel family protein
VIVPATKLSDKESVIQQIRRIEADGSTALFAGVSKGADELRKFLDKNRVNRVILLSDGLANVGVTDRSELERHAAALRERGIRTDTFGVGSDFDENLLDSMAVAGGGHAYFIEQEVQIRDFITSAVGEALDIVARDVRLEVSVPDGVVVEPMGLFTTSTDGDRAVVEIGDLVSGQRLELVLRLNFPHGDIGRSMRATFRLRDAEGMFDQPELTIWWQYADDRTNDLQPRDRDVDRAVARRYAARARQEALDLNRRGSFDSAAQRLQAVADRIRGYAGGDDELLRIARALDGERASFAAPMAAFAMKEAHFRSSYEMRGRDIRGRAQRADG